MVILKGLCTLFSPLIFFSFFFQYFVFVYSLYFDDWWWWWYVCCLMTSLCIHDILYNTIDDMFLEFHLYGWVWKVMSVVYLQVRSEGEGQMSFHLPVVGPVSRECMILEAKRSSFHIYISNELLLASRIIHSLLTGPTTRTWKLIWTFPSYIYIYNFGVVIKIWNVMFVSFIRSKGVGRGWQVSRGD